MESNLFVCAYVLFVYSNLLMLLLTFLTPCKAKTFLVKAEAAFEAAADSRSRVEAASEAGPFEPSAPSRGPYEP